MKANYHTHTKLCGHAVGDVEDYVKAAIEFNIEEIGITDHVPFDLKHVPFKPKMRMELTDKAKYLEDIAYCKNKYQSMIKIHSGFEVEYVKTADLDGYYETLKSQVDYMILGQHFIPDKNGNKSSFFFDSDDDVIAYGDVVVEALESGYFKLLAHPDVYCRSLKNWSSACEITARKIIQKSKELNIPLEINCNGIRLGKIQTNTGETYTYPRSDFWKIVAEYDCDVMINSDAHAPEELNDFAIEEAQKIIEKFNLKLIEKIKI